jgi:hypothetical protein
MLSKTAWARAVALSSAIAILTAAIPAGAALAQETPSVALEQARRGEDGVSGAGAASGNMESGSAKRDKNGNAKSATAGGAGETATATGSEEGSSGGGEEAPPLPANADLLSALGILDDVTIYGVDVLSDMDIPVELIPAPVETSAPAAPTDVNTGGQGADGANISSEPASGSAPADVNTGGQSSDSANISTEPGSSAGPAGGSTSSAAEDGAGASETGKKRDKAAKDAGAANNTNGGTETATATG